MTDEIQFNVLTTPWIPLSGSAEPASFVELLVGERDAPDLDWPRDDFKVFTRLLLSALAQALLTPATTGELMQRVRQPMRRADVEAAISPYLSDFELFPAAGAGFLQSLPRNDSTSAGAARFLFGGADLFPAATRTVDLSIPVALVALFAEQTYSGGAGRGYGAGPAGQPGVFSLVDPGTVRKAVWANVLASGNNDKAPDPSRPWTNAELDVRPRGAVGLVEGLFFQPRAIWFSRTSAEACSLTGVRGPTVRLDGFLGKHSLAPDKSVPWVHPCAPMELKSTGLAPVRLAVGQPAWTGLAQILEPVSKKSSGKVRDPRVGAALTLQQWSKGYAAGKYRLIILDYDRDKAIIRGSFYEAYSLSTDLSVDPARLRALSGDAEEVAGFLSRALTSAHDDQKRGGFARADALASYWSMTESAFVAWLEASSSVAMEGTDLSARDAAIEAASGALRSSTRGCALRLFDAHVALSEWNIVKQSPIAGARRRLRNSLWPRPPADSVQPRSPRNSKEARQ